MAEIFPFVKRIPPGVITSPVPVWMVAFERKMACVWALPGVGTDWEKPVVRIRKCMNERRIVFMEFNRFFSGFEEGKLLFLNSMP